MNKNQYIIGISSYYHDSSVCLFKNGQMVFACEEEKFTGIKHDSSFPNQALNYIIKNYKIERDEIEMICFYESPDLKLTRVINNIKSQILKNPLYSISSLYKIKKNTWDLKKELKKYSDNIFYSTHHESHQYYSFFSSNFKNAVCLSIDGVGEVDTLSMGIADDSGIDYITMAEYPHSLGLFYSTLTSFLGFKPNEGEYKVMGLAPYGDPEKYIENVRKLIKYDDNSLTCNMDVFCWDKSTTQMFNYKLLDLLNIDPRVPDSEITQDHKNLAAAVQKRYEEILFDVIKSVSLIDENSNLCLSGGCAYNGTANGKIISNTHFNNLWIPLAPSDAGSSVGACIHYMVKNNKLIDRIPKNPFLGPSYHLDDFVKNTKNLKYFKYKSEEMLLKKVAEKLRMGKVIGWYRGHIEFGARALGNRSILADPTIPEMKDKINKVIKKREGFRPFAPMVIKEKQHQYFHVHDDVPFMNQIVKVKSEYIDELPSITHVDGTARIQTVYKNTPIYNLLLEFEKLSGFPILLNTSFNVKDKTMVLTPKDAVETFMDTEMDYLIMGNYIIYK
jgi:carbamoyltransferase